MGNRFTVQVQDSSGKIFDVEVEDSSSKQSSPKQERSLKQDIPGIASEALSGALGDAPRNLPRNPMALAIGGPSLVQMQQGANTPINLLNILRPSSPLPVPFPDEKRQLPQILPEPQTDLGKALGVGANILGGVFGQPGQAFLRGTGLASEAVASRMAGPNKVKDIQKAFGPFHKEATTKFGQAIRTGTKNFKNTGIPIVVKGEVEAIFNPILSAGSEARLPKVAKDIANNIDNFGVDELLRKKATLQRSLSAAERSGKLSTDRSRIIGQTVSNIDKSIRSRIPEIGKANEEYAVFSRVKEMIEKFEPEFAKMPSPFGTSSGEKILRNVMNMTSEEIDLLRRFENASGLKIVGPARQAATIKKLTGIIGKIALYGGAIGMGGALFGRPFTQAIDAAN